jgi:hypothetical protein
MPQEPRLEMLPDKAMKLSGSTFRKIVRRIESIVPLAGDRITVTPKDGGYEITADEPPAPPAPPTPNVRTITVCVNGSPSSIQVYVP